MEEMAGAFEKVRCPQRRCEARQVDERVKVPAQVHDPCSRIDRLPPRRRSCETSRIGGFALSLVSGYSTGTMTSWSGCSPPQWRSSSTNSQPLDQTSQAALTQSCVRRAATSPEALDEPRHLGIMFAGAVGDHLATCASLHTDDNVQGRIPETSGDV